MIEYTIEVDDEMISNLEMRLCIEMHCGASQCPNTPIKYFAASGKVVSYCDMHIPHPMPSVWRHYEISREEALVAEVMYI